MNETSGSSGCGHKAPRPYRPVFRERAFCCAVLAAALVCAAWVGGAAARETITVLAFDYPPIYQAAGPDRGLSCEIVVEAFKTVGIDVNLEFYPVTRMVATVSSGRALCGIGGRVLFLAPEIERNVAFSEVVQYVSQVFLYDSRKYPEGIQFGQLSDMDVYSVGVLNGSGIMKYLEQAGSLNLVTNVTHDGSARQLQSRRIDVWAIVDLTGMMFMKNIFPSEYSYYRFTKSFNLGDVSLVFSKARDSGGVYDAKFRAGLTEIKRNGVYMDIMAKYYGGVDAINREALTPDMR